MNKLITKNPVQRFKEGRKIVKAKTGTSLFEFGAKDFGGIKTNKNGNRYYTIGDRNIFENGEIWSTKTGTKVGINSAIAKEYASTKDREQNQPTKKSVRVPKSTVATDNKPKEGQFTKKLRNATRVSFPMLNIPDAVISGYPNETQKVVDVAVKAFDALPGGFQLFPGLRMPIDIHKTRQGKESSWSLLKPIAPYLFHEVSPNTNQKITNEGDLNIISSNTPDWLLRRMGPITQKTATPTTVVEQPVQKTEVEQPVQETESVPTASSETPTFTSTTVTSSTTNLGKRNSGRRNSRRNYRTTKTQSNILSTPLSYNIGDLSGQIVTPTFEKVATTIETPNIIAPTATYNRKDTRQFLRDMGFNPYNFTGDQRRALRMVINGVADDYDRNLVQQMGL